MNLFDQINEDIKKAMLNKEPKDRLEALRANKIQDDPDFAEQLISDEDIKMVYSIKFWIVTHQKRVISHPRQQSTASN